MDASTRDALHLLAASFQPQANEYCLLWANWWATCLTKSEWASWVQAVGSIAAIGIAIVVTRQQALSQRARDEDLRRQRALEIVSNIAQLFEQTAACTTTLSGLFDSNGSTQKFWKSAGAACQDMLDQLRTVPPLDLPAADLVRHLALARQRLITYIAYCEKMDTPSVDQDWASGAAAFVDESRKSETEARNACASFLSTAPKPEKQMAATRP